MHQFSIAALSKSGMDSRISRRCRRPDAHDPARYYRVPSRVVDVSSKFQAISRRKLQLIATIREAVFRVLGEIDHCVVKLPFKQLYVFV